METTEDFSAELLNTALELATEWGENFRKPIHERLRAFYPELTDEQIDRLTEIVREAEYYIYGLAEREVNGEIRGGDIPSLARDRFPWLNDSNISRLTNIGTYYAHR